MPNQVHFCFMKKWFWYKMYGPVGLWRIKSWSEPALYQTRVDVFCRGNSNPDIYSGFPFIFQYLMTIYSANMTPGGCALVHAAQLRHESSESGPHGPTTQPAEDTTVPFFDHWSLGVIHGKFPGLSGKPKGFFTTQTIDCEFTRARTWPRGMDVNPLRHNAVKYQS